MARSFDATPPLYKSLLDPAYALLRKSLATSSESRRQRLEHALAHPAERSTRAMKNDEEIARHVVEELRWTPELENLRGNVSGP
jgi:hypothetical protein